MTKEDMTMLVEFDYAVTSNGLRVDLIQGNQGKFVVGFFQRFPDYEELKEQNQWRFIINPNAGKFHETQSIELSIIINGDNVVRIIPLNPKFRELTKEDFKRANLRYVWERDHPNQETYTQWKVGQAGEDILKISRAIEPDGTQVKPTLMTMDSHILPKHLGIGKWYVDIG